MKDTPKKALPLWMESTEELLKNYRFLVALKNKFPEFDLIDVLEERYLALKQELKQRTGQYGESIYGESIL